MCHLACWIINGDPKEGHGKVWKGWYVCMSAYLYGKFTARLTGQRKWNVKGVISKLRWVSRDRAKGGLTERFRPSITTRFLTHTNGVSGLWSPLYIIQTDQTICRMRTMCQNVGALSTLRACILILIGTDMVDSANQFVQMNVVCQLYMIPTQG